MASMVRSQPDAAELPPAASRKSSLWKVERTRGLVWISASDPISEIVIAFKFSDIEEVIYIDEPLIMRYLSFYSAGLLDRIRAFRIALAGPNGAGSDATGIRG